jgi:hypothetical protein
LSGPTHEADFPELIDLLDDANHRSSIQAVGPVPTRIATADSARPISARPTTHPISPIQNVLALRQVSVAKRADALRREAD